MPSVLSTLRNTIYGREWSFPYNCYEVGHGWTPYCSQAAVDVGGAAFKNVLPLYTSLYLFTQLGLQRKFQPAAFLETFKSILTSASFLSFNLFLGMSISCVLRNNSDRYYYRVQCFLPGLLASYMALLVERPSRRPALAFYMANMSSELLFKWYVEAGYIKPLPHGETILFAIGMACWLRFVRIHGFGHDPVSVALKYLLGPLEAKSRAKNATANGLQKNCDAVEGKLAAQQQEDQSPAPVNAQEHTTTTTKPSQHRKSVLAKLDAGINDFLNQFFTCHHVCPHKGICCVNYTLTPALTRFVWGYLGRSALNLVPKFKTLAKQPGQAFREAILSKNSLYVGLFLSSFVGVSRASHCILRRYSGKQEIWHSVVAGFLSGGSMLFAPKPTLSIYVIWKCLEQYFFLAVKNGQIVRADQMVGVVYAVSVNILLYVFALQPKFIRPSYMKFIDNLSDHRLHQVNRMVLDIFHPKASVGYEEWFPNLDPKFMSREFQELIFNWLIQPS
jgi:hypothetical protein